MTTPDLCTAALLTAGLFSLAAWACYRYWRRGAALTGCQCGCKRVGKS